MSPARTNRPHLVPPELAAHIPTTRTASAVALVIGVLSAAALVVQAVSLATVVDRSLLHHVSLANVRGDLIAVAVAVVARSALAFVGERFSERTAESVVASLRGQLLRQTFSLGPSWLATERTGELSLTATRGLRALHVYFARYLPQAAMAAVVPIVLLVWVATQDWLSLVVVVALVLAVPLTMVYFGREANRRTARQWRRLGSLAGRFLQLIEGLPTLRAFGRQSQGRREVIESSEGVRVATMRTLRVAFLSALSMDLIAGFGVGFVAMVLGLRLLWGELSLQTAMAVLLVAPEIFIPLRRASAEFPCQHRRPGCGDPRAGGVGRSPDHSARPTPLRPPRPPSPPSPPRPHDLGRTASASAGCASTTPTAPDRRSTTSHSTPRREPDWPSSGLRAPANQPSWPPCSSSWCRRQAPCRSGRQRRRTLTCVGGATISHGFPNARTSSPPAWPRTSASARPKRPIANSKK